MDVNVRSDPYWFDFVYFFSRIGRRESIKSTVLQQRKSESRKYLSFTLCEYPFACPDKTKIYTSIR